MDFNSPLSTHDKLLQMKDIRLVVFGGREFKDFDTLYRVLDYVHANCNIITIIHGTARGADKFAGLWADKNFVPEYKFKPNWDAYPGVAGHMRNQKMIDVGKPDCGIAFPGGPGTVGMLGKMADANLLVWEPLKDDAQ